MKPLTAVALAAGLALAGTASAQQASRLAPSPEMQQRIAQAKARLQLTPEQEPQLRALLEEEGGKLRALQQKYAGDGSAQAHSAKRQEARAIQQDFRGKLQAVLTPQQLTEWDQMASERRAEMRERRHQP
jgi:Skp family chaperone for outer membrane proteins